MHHRIDTILTQLRQDVARHLDADSIRSACGAIGHTWRKCRLDPVAIVHRFVTRILQGNTALAHVALLGGRRFTEGGSDEGGLEELVEFLLSRSSRSVIRRSKECTNANTAACAAGGS